jgi:hypothetical protein
VVGDPPDDQERDQHGDGSFDSEGLEMDSSVLSPNEQVGVNMDRDAEIEQCGPCR